jgi:hypothetical protein
LEEALEEEEGRGILCRVKLKAVGFYQNKGMLEV